MRYNASILPHVDVVIFSLVFLLVVTGLASLVCTEVYLSIYSDRPERLGVCLICGSSVHFLYHSGESAIRLPLRQITVPRLDYVDPLSYC